jgi:hypothetical protein
MRVTAGVSRGSDDAPALDDERQHGSRVLLPDEAVA